MRNKEKVHRFLHRGKLRYLLRTLVIVVLGMFNILDSSALFFTDSDSVIINSFVSVHSSAPFRLMRAENKFSEAKQKEMWPFLSDLTLNLMLNDWINGVSKHKQLLFLFFRELCNFFSCSLSEFVCFYFNLLIFPPLLTKRAPCIKFSCWYFAQRG